MTAQSDIGPDQSYACPAFGGSVVYPVRPRFPDSLRVPPETAELSRSAYESVSCRFVLAVLSLLSCQPLPAAAGLPQAPATAAAQQPPAKPATRKPEQKPTSRSPSEPPKYEETVVVSASQRRGEAGQRAGDDERDHRRPRSRPAPSPNFAELLRSIPGVNITQVSARDINVTSRGATGTLATGQLALLDGRSLYQDFFGFVMWDFLPVNLNEVKQIEVIRGPASAVWGANALNGVVNVITQVAARDAGHERRVSGSAASTAPDAGRRLAVVRQRHHAADAPNERWAYKLSAGGYSQDAFARPTGQIPCDDPRGLRGPTSDLSRRSSTRARRSRSSTPASTTTTRTAASCRSPAASPAPTASCTPASARSTSAAAR